MKIAVPYYNQQTLQSYYRWHAHFYDLTRWSFLFGRRKLMRKLPPLPHSPRILEVGCGTGHNLKKLNYRYPDAKITGIDLSPDMLSIASKKADEKRINFIHGIYEQELETQTFDLILLSYSLTMIKTPVERILTKLSGNLRDDGTIAVVDFHQTPYRWFGRWMQKNHVEMNGQWLPVLQSVFDADYLENSKAYFGLWSYFLFIGSNN